MLFVRETILTERATNFGFSHYRDFPGSETSDEPAHDLPSSRRVSERRLPCEAVREPTPVGGRRTNEPNEGDASERG